MESNLVEILIEEVRQNECLFDLSSPDYKNNFVKEKVWKNISVRLGVSDDVCKKRWRTLRDTYKRNKHRLQIKSGSAADDGANGSRWKYFQRLSFLDDVASTRVTTGNIADKENESPQEDTSTTSHTSSPLLSSAPTTPPLEPLAKKRRVLKDHFATVLTAASQSIQEFRSALEERRKGGSTVQLMTALGHRVENSDLSEEEIIEIEMEISHLVFSKLTQFKNKIRYE